jgi:hypothetical protein
MAMRWAIRFMLGGAVLAATAFGALAQKPPQGPANPDRLAGNWVFEGQSGDACRMTRMLAGMVITAPRTPGGDYRVTSRRAIRVTAGRGCPPVDGTEKLEELEGAARVQGGLVAIVLRGRDGRVHTLGYRLGDHSLASLCTDCIERGIPWRRTAAAPAPARKSSLY